MPPAQATRDQRVTLALKYHYLDGLSAVEIRDRFEEEGIGDFARSTIRRYLNDSPKEEVLEQIEKEQAHVREQIAEREERMFHRARDAELAAVQNEPIQRVRPKVKRVPHNSDRVPKQAWEDVEPGDEDWPEWANERDYIVRFTGEETFVGPGQLYPVQGLDGEPQYTTEMVGIERDVPDRTERSFLRREQSDHLEKKGEALGVYDEAEDRQADALEEIADGLDLTLSMEDKEALDEANDVEPDTML